MRFSQKTVRNIIEIWLVFQMFGWKMKTYFCLVLLCLTCYDLGAFGLVNVYYGTR